MIELHFEKSIRASAERVFGLLVELREYDRWLPRSAAFRGTSQISDGPIREGTTYLEDSPSGVRRGRVTRLLRPTQLDFEQPMHLKPRILGQIGIRLFHTLTPTTDGVHVLRRLELSPRGPMRAVMPLVVRAFRAENQRMLEILRNVAETRK